MGDANPTYQLTIVEQTPNPAFNPESLKRKPYDPEPSGIESTRYFERQMFVTLSRDQYEKVKKAVLENWA